MLRGRGLRQNASSAGSEIVAPAQAFDTVDLRCAQINARAGARADG
jgi:hypothetical protein